MALLEVKDLTKTFQKQGNRITAVDHVTLEMAEGECLGLIGESGCGKSTTAALIARLLKEDSGTIRLCGRELTGTRSLRRAGSGLQMIFQNAQDSFDPKDDVLHGVMQGAASYKMYNKKELRTEGEKALRYVGLREELWVRKCRELSGGEAQRAAIARAILCHPKLLICDEVTSALDVLVREEILQLLLRLKREGEMGILFITHDLPLAARICDRIAVMERGTIVETGPANQVLTNPSAAETKRLIEAILTL